MSKEIRFCPNCGSTNVDFDTSHTNVIGEMISNQNQWVCQECDYRGLMPQGNPKKFEQGLEDEDENIEFEPVQQEVLDTSLGSAYFKYFVYISVPIITIYTIFKLLLG